MKDEKLAFLVSMIFAAASLQAAGLVERLIAVFLAVLFLVLYVFLRDKKPF